MYWVYDIGDFNNYIQSEHHDDQQKCYVQTKDETSIGRIHQVESVLVLLHQFRLILGIVSGALSPYQLNALRRNLC